MSDRIDRTDRADRMDRMDRAERERKNLHAGHRSRLRARFRETGLEGFEKHEILELLLQFGIPYRDTNGLAHRLIDYFGGVAAVVDADYAELAAFDGIGEHAATLLKLIPELVRVYEIEHADIGAIVGSSSEAGAVLLPRFRGLVEEAVFMLCIDAKGKVLGIDKVASGDVNAAIIGLRSAVSVALRYNASVVVLAHNHTSGIAVPSPEDVKATEQIMDALAPLGIMLIDHIITDGTDFVSMADSDLLHDRNGKLIHWGMDSEQNE